MAYQKIASFCDGGFGIWCLVWECQTFSKNLGQHTPEAVLWVHVKEAEFAAFGRGHCAQEENFTFFVPDRRKRMCYQDAVGHGVIIA